MEEEKKIKIILVVGPTATGKTSLAVKLSERFNGEIISADSRQVYKGMDIGSGKDISEYGNIPYHLIDVVEPDQNYNLMRFRNEVPEIIMDIVSRDRVPIVAGGSALYIDSLLSGYMLPGKGPDTMLREELRKLDAGGVAGLLEQLKDGDGQMPKDRKNRNRLLRAYEIAATGGFSARPLPFAPDFLVIGTYYHRKEVHRRIEQRLEARLKQGMVEEVRRLHEQGVTWERLEFFGLEYRYVALYLQGKLEYDEMRRRLLEKIRQFAKRQDIWYRKMEREGHIIHWICDGSSEKAALLVETFLSGGRLPEPELRISGIYYGDKTS